MLRLVCTYSVCVSMYVCVSVLGDDGGLGGSRSCGAAVSSLH